MHTDNVLTFRRGLPPHVTRPALVVVVPYWSLSPLHFVSWADKRVWFADYAEWCRQAALDLLHGTPPRYPVAF